VHGTALLFDDHGKHVLVRVGPTGIFKVSLPPGNYLAIGHSPMVHVGTREMTCNALAPIVVHPRRPATVAVACQIS
jgi:hypothetical protein